MESNQQNAILSPVKIEFTPEQIDVLRNTIAKDATEPELNLFIQACVSYGLDPFKKELFFSKNKNSGRVDLITGRDGYLAIVQRDPRFIGLQSMEVYSKDDFTIEYDTGGELKIHHKILTINPNERGELIGAWATCIFKDRTDATVFVYLDEYKKMTHDNWKKYPSAMIRKVPESIVMKRQGGISGLVTQEEIGFTPTNPMQLPPPKQAENTIKDIHSDQYSINRPEPSPPKYPKDVTDQYRTKTDDDNKVTHDVVQTSAGDMFTEYLVDGAIQVLKSVDNDITTCKTCQSADCEHVKKVKAYISEIDGGTE